LLFSLKCTLEVFVNDLGSHSFDSFRALLLAEFAKRTQRRPQYSLRAFARFLDVEPSILSKILRGKVAITSERVTRLAPRLGLSDEDAKRYIEALRKEKNRAAVAPAAIFDGTYGASQMSLARCQSGAEWHHFAILELIKIQGFRPDAEWIAATLGISREETENAVTKLKRLGLLEITDNGEWRNNSENGENAATGSRHQDPSPVHDGPIVRHHDLLDRAKAAVETVPLELRDQASVTFAIDAALVPEIKQRLLAFRCSLAEFIEKKSKEKNHVYVLTCSLFPLSKPQISETQPTHDSSMAGS
jgi:uncharacterized protein (TIGR02147 family)